MNMSLIINFEIAVGDNKQFNKQIKKQFKKQFMEGQCEKRIQHN